MKCSARLHAKKSFLSPQLRMFKVLYAASSPSLWNGMQQQLHAACSLPWVADRKRKKEEKRGAEKKTSALFWNVRIWWMSYSSNSSTPPCLIRPCWQKREKGTRIPENSSCSFYLCIQAERSYDYDYTTFISGHFLGPWRYWIRKGFLGVSTVAAALKAWKEVRIQT